MMMMNEENKPIKIDKGIRSFADKSNSRTKIAVEKYVKNHLSDNPQNLQRIYYQLKDLNKVINYQIQQKRKKSSSPLPTQSPDHKNIIKKEEDYKNNEQQNYLNNTILLNQDCCQAIQKQKHSITSNNMKKLQLKKLNKTSFPLSKAKSCRSRSITNLQQIQNRKKLSLSTAPLSTGQRYFQRNKQQNISKRNQRLIKTLREKGVRTISTERNLGMQIAAEISSRMSKPLQVNSHIQLRDKDSQMAECLNRYQLNKPFYQNSQLAFQSIHSSLQEEQNKKDSNNPNSSRNPSQNPQNSNPTKKINIDKNMIWFMQRKSVSLAKLTQKGGDNDLFIKGPAGITSNTWKHKRQSTQSKLFRRTTKSIYKVNKVNEKNIASSSSKLSSNTTTPVLTNYNYHNNDRNDNKQFNNNNNNNNNKLFIRQKQLQNLKLLKYCENSLQKKNQITKCLMQESQPFHQLRKQNQNLNDKMEALQNILQNRLGYDNSVENELKIDQDLLEQKLKDSLIDKYSLNYLRNIKSKPKSTIINNNRNDLLKNEAKFKSIISGNI